MVKAGRPAGAECRGSALGRRFARWLGGGFGPFVRPFVGPFVEFAEPGSVSLVVVQETLVAPSVKGLGFRLGLKAVGDFHEIAAGIETVDLPQRAQGDERGAPNPAKLGIGNALHGFTQNVGHDLAPDSALGTAAGNANAGYRSP